MLLHVDGGERQLPLAACPWRRSLTTNECQAWCACSPVPSNPPGVSRFEQCRCEQTETFCGHGESNRCIVRYTG